MKELPKYFVIRQDSTNPLWRKYIEWLNNKYRVLWRGTWYKFYGYTGCMLENGTEVKDKLSDFINDPTLITLEEWDECVNGFTLPEAWHIVVTEENFDIVARWRFGAVEPPSDFGIGVFVGITHKNGSKEWSSTGVGFGREITFEQFLEYVWMKERKGPIGYKLNSLGEKYWEAAIHIGFIHTLKGVIDKGRAKGRAIKEINKEVSNNLTVRRHFMDASLLDLWFDPVYAPKYSLPKINGYDGEYNKAYNKITYGCVGFNVGHLCGLYNNLNISDSRSIKSITLSSNVTITIDQIKQILDYVENQ